MEANKEAIDNLISNAKEANKELYYSILEDASSFKRCGQDIPALLRYVPELRMDIKFILVDLQTSMSACFSTDRFYEKRYHLKNLYAGMLEGYKLLYGFGKMRNRTIWARLGEEINKEVVGNPKEESIFKAIKQEYDNITQELLGIEATKTDQDDRNLTYHYDDDLLLVYRLTLKTNSEEEAALKYIVFLRILGKLLELGNLIEAIYLKMGCCLPGGFARNNEIALMIVKKVAETFGQNPMMQTVLLESIDRGAKQIDDYAHNKQSFIDLEKHIEKQFKQKVDIPELGIIKSLLDVQLMVTFMMTDASTIMRGFIGAGSNVEYPLILRRLTVSRVSTLNHLISYRKDVSDSMWGKILTIVPRNNKLLIEEAHSIRDELISMRHAGDLDKRALYVHLIDNHNYNSNIPDIVSSLENPEILLELDDSKNVIALCGRISKFMVKLLDVLSEQAHKARIKSDRLFRRRINQYKRLADHPNCPDFLRSTIREQMNEVEQLLMRFN